MPVDLITLMQFESGELTEIETVEMVAEMLESGEIKTLPDKFQSLAKQYIRKGYISKDGEILI